MITIRKALPEDMEWVNAQYQKIKFQLSDHKNEIIGIAELNGQRAGIGRLVTIDDTVLELGGIYVLEGYREHGIARTIVTFMISQVKDKTLYCLPFEHLQQFYYSCGFVSAQNTEQVPAKILQKWKWCNGTYPGATLLLVQQV